MIELFEREELQALIRKARQNLNAVTNPEWKMAFENFIFACSVLDAFEARSSVPSCARQGHPIELGSPEWVSPIDSQSKAS